MRTRLQRVTERRHPTPERRGGHLAPARPAPVPAPSEPELRVREAGGPEDQAAYSCACGMRFEAPVSTSVSCPHCGTGQAW
jgi:hypothetical protein